MGQTDDGYNARPPLLSHFGSFEGYPSSFRRLSTGVLGQTLRNIAPTPLQLHQPNYYAARDPSYVPLSSPFTPAVSKDGFHAEPTPFPTSADNSGICQSSSQVHFGQGVGCFPHGTTHCHASRLGLELEYQRWTGASAAEQLHDRPFLARSNTLTSLSPFPSDIPTQQPGGVFPSVALQDYTAASQFSSPTANDTSLTSTQIAALCGQPLPPDHPFYSEVQAQINDFQSESASKGESMSVHFQSKSVVLDAQY